MPSTLRASVAATTTMLCLASAASAAVIATDSYVIGTDPAAGQYQDGVLLRLQPATLVNTGFVNGPYGSGTGTSQFSATSNGLDSTLPMIDSASSGKVNYGASLLDSVYRANARNLSPAVPASATYWISHTVNRGDIPQAGGSGYVLTGFGNTVAPDPGTTTGNLDGLFVGFAQNGNAANFASLVIRYRDGTNTTSDAVLIDGAAASTFGTTYTVLMRLDVNVGGGSNDAVAWWVDPTDFSSEAALTTSSAATGSFSSLAFQTSASFARLNYSSRNWNGNAFFDEPRLTTTLADIAIPEPASLSLLGLGGLTLLRRRR